MQPFLVSEELSLKYLSKMLQLTTLSMKYWLEPSVGVDLTINLILGHGGKSNQHSQKLMSLLNKFLNQQKSRDSAV